MPPERRLNLGLIGYPLGHSISPRIHRAALAAAGRTGDYHLYPVPPLPGGASPLTDRLAQMRAGEIHGLNVTIPHKQAVIALLDDLDPAAAAAGAVNTISTDGRKLIGWNTDITGFLADLDGLTAERGGRALVLGAGGAARAVICALHARGWRTDVSARDPEQAARLESDLGGIEALFDLPPAAADLSRHPPDLLVNATPVGMAPAGDRSPWPKTLALPPACAVYDLVYNPRETRLVDWARRAGHQAAGGLGMLVHQAAQAFEIWTGIRPDLEAMFEAVRERPSRSRDPD